MSAIEDRPGGARSGGPGDLGTLGRYQLLEPIGSGGMGAVYLARLAGEGGFEKFVALKVLLPDISQNARFVAMFLDEARIAARLSHPNLCEVYELGSADGRYYIAMQYLRGVPLNELMRAHPRDRGQHIRLIASLIAQACEGLHHAHEITDASSQPLSIVHRDISPPNLFVTTEGVLKVLDFGIAKARDVESKTRRSEVKGKQAYMSPEQLVGNDLDRRSDLFSLAVVLYEGMTATRLFSRETDYLIAKAILEEAVDDPRSRRPEISPALGAVTLRALSRHPRDRFSTARDLGNALSTAMAPSRPMLPAEIADYLKQEFAARLATDEARFERATHAARRISDGTDSSLRNKATTRTRRGPSRLLPIALVIAALAVAAVAVFFFALRQREERPGAAAKAEADAAVVATAIIDAGAVRNSSADAVPIADAAVDATDLRPGTISIDSTPYATIYVDGRRAGVTPLIGHRVKPGRRRIKAVLASGETRRFSIRVRPGKQAPAKRLTW